MIAKSTTFSVALAPVLVVAACGDSGGKASDDAAIVRPDADLGADAPSCSALPCLAGATGLIAYCAPSGTCTSQVTVSGGIATMNRCFSNGAKIQLTAVRADGGGTNTIMTVKKDGAACYSFVIMATADPSVGSAVYRDGAGTDLITGTVDGATTTYTCPGGSPVTPDSACDAALFALQGAYPFTNATCTSGTCAF